MAITTDTVSATTITSSAGDVTGQRVIMAKSGHGLTMSNSNGTINTIAAAAGDNIKLQTPSANLWIGGLNGDAAEINTDTPIISTEDISTEGYTKLGEYATPIKMTVLTGTTANTYNGTATITTGIAYGKILGVHILVTSSGPAFIFPASYSPDFTNYGYSYRINLNGDIEVVNACNDGSTQIVSKSLTILVIYKE